ncbi:lysine transporter LysE [Caenispirillum bisanense]|uniref:LysE family translocator n=1 Tax=Caenispirillum bisanense TaxID=414052 RepID=UPI0031DA4808
MQDPILFALAVLSLLATPGPTNTLLATAGGTVGIRRALPLIGAEAAGYMIAICTLGLVVGPAVAAAPALGVALRLMVGVWLLVTAWRMWHKGAAMMASRGTVVTLRQVFVVTLLNPKAIIFALAVVPFGTAPVLPYLIGFCALTAVVATGWISAGALLGRAPAATGRHTVVPRVGAAVISVFGLLLVTSPLVG